MRSLKHYKLETEEEQELKYETTRRRNAAIQIQSRWRGTHIRLEIWRGEQKYLQSILAQQREFYSIHAVKIQTAWRRKHARTIVSRRRDQQAREKASAVKIQSITRGRIARKALEKRRTQQAEDAAAEIARQKQEQAAVKIQSMTRGRITRKTLEKRRIEEAARQKVSVRQEQAAVKIQSITRGRIARKRGLAEQEAAIKIQSVIRGKIARRTVQAERYARWEQAQWDWYMEAAIITIQKVWRGKLARKAFANRRAEEYERISGLEHSHEIHEAYHIINARQKAINYRDRCVEATGVLMALQVTGTEQGQNGWYYQGGVRGYVYYFTFSANVRKNYILEKRSNVLMDRVIGVKPLVRLPSSSCLIFMLELKIQEIKLNCHQTGQGFQQIAFCLWIASINCPVRRSFQTNPIQSLLKDRNGGESKQRRRIHGGAPLWMHQNFTHTSIE